MDFSKLVLNRQSVRAYSDKSIDRGELIKCIEAARLAPSACNSQPWKYIIVDEADLLEKIAKETYGKVASFNKFTHKAKAIAVVVMESGNVKSKIGSHIKDIDYAHMDLGNSVAHFCLQAADLGLGTCILGWFKENNIKKLLNIPERKKIGLLISIGYPKDNKIRKKVRKNVNEMSSFNKY